MTKVYEGRRLVQSVTVPHLTDVTPEFVVLGVRVHAIQIPAVIARVERWIRKGASGHYVALTGMHGVSEALHDAGLRALLNAPECLVVADGMPLVWLGRRHGHPMARRVYGPELMESFLRQTRDRYRHFFYGGAPGVADHLTEVMRQRFGARVVGTYCPPFRPLTVDEKRDVVSRIRTAVPDVLWVGLSTPKQERWMSEYLPLLNVPVLIGVGAAFDFHTGRLQQAPVWMRENGLEWLFRLLREPRRLWRRYLINGSQFAWNVSLELLNIKRFA